jgi:hypothetical protein
MKKKILSLILALSLLLLTSCADTGANETTKATVSPTVIDISAEGLELSDISVAAGGQKAAPFFVSRYVNADGIAADGPLMFGYPESDPDRFDIDKKEFPIVYCNSLEDIKFFVGEEEQTGIELHLFDADGLPTEFTGVGTYYAYANVRAERGENRISYGAFFIIRPVGTENEPIKEELSEKYNISVKINEEPLLTYTSEKFTKSVELLVFDTHGSDVPYISESVIEGAAAEVIYSLLENAVPTGEAATSIAEGMTLEEADASRMLTEGTYWFVLDCGIYRLESDGRVAKVESLTGAGEYVDTGANFAKKAELISKYGSDNVYLGIINGTELELNNISKNSSAVEMKITSIGAMQRDNFSSRTFAITVLLTAKEDTTAYLYYGDYPETNYDYTAFSGKEIILKAGVPTAVSVKKTVAAYNIFYLSVGGNLIEIRQAENPLAKSN